MRLTQSARPKALEGWIHFCFSILFFLLGYAALSGFLSTQYASFG